MGRNWEGGKGGNKKVTVRVHSRSLRSYDSRFGRSLVHRLEGIGNRRGRVLAISLSSTCILISATSYIWACHGRPSRSGKAGVLVMAGSFIKGLMVEAHVERVDE